MPNMPGVPAAPMLPTITESKVTGDTEPIKKVNSFGFFNLEVFKLSDVGWLVLLVCKLVECVSLAYVKYCDASSLAY